MKAFEMFADEHPTLSGIIVAVVFVLVFGIVGGIERGTIALPF